MIFKNKLKIIEELDQNKLNNQFQNGDDIWK